MDEAALDAQNEVEVVEQYEISDDEADEFDYDAVQNEEDEEEDDDDDEDFAAALASVQRLDEKSRAGSTVASVRDVGTPAAKPVLTQVRPEVVDDFIRNFLIKVGMSRTLDNFNSEWYDLQQKGKLAEVYTDTVPDIYVRNQDLDERVVALQQQLDKMRIITEKAQGTWDKFRKERDFHRMHHRRVRPRRPRIAQIPPKVGKKTTVHLLSWRRSHGDASRRKQTPASRETAAGRARKGEADDRLAAAAETLFIVRTHSKRPPEEVRGGHEGEDVCLPRPRPSRCCVFVSTASRRHDLRQRAREARGPVAAMAWGA